MKTNPIGVFDSGIGGLTVVNTILQQVPNEKIIYIGDTARVPYGTRRKETIIKFSRQLALFLLKKKVKMLVAACNTISSTSLKEIKKISPVPVIGVIRPMVKEALKTTKRNKIGVIGTPATINSLTYVKKTRSLDPRIKIIQQACPLFVPIVEEGLFNHPVASLMANHYLKPLVDLEIDTLILGCTHYPLLRRPIQKTVGQGIKIIESGEPTAKEIKKELEKHKLLTSKPQPTHQFYLTDLSDKTIEIAQTFLGKPLPATLKKVNLPFD